MEALHQAWHSRAQKAKYGDFADALQDGYSKIAGYYEKTATSDAFLLSMGMYLLGYLVTMLTLPLVLDPEMKMKHFEMYWEQDLQDTVKETLEKIVSLVPSLLT